jgi:RHS repeat-associated protein
MNPTHRSSAGHTFKRLLAGTLIASQSLLTFPIQTLIAGRQDQSRRVSDPPAVRVNKTKPTRGVPSEVPVLSTVPTTREISETRLLPEPLRPVGTPTDADNVALAAVLRVLPQQPTAERWSRITQHMAARPESPWHPSLLLNAGLLLLRDGYQTRAASLFKSAWNLARHDGSAAGIAVADRAIGQLLTLEARQGHEQTLAELLQDVGARELTGAATEQLSGAKQALAVMRHAPEEVFRCGPYALAQLMAAVRGTRETRVMMTRTGPRGISLKGLSELAARNGFPVVPVRRQTGDALPVPAVVHFKSDHFATLVRREGNRYLVKDATDQDGDLWYIDAALQEELSGAALVLADAMPAGWQAMSPVQAAEVWGRGDASAPPPPPGPSSPGSPPCDCGGGGGGAGMASYQVHLLEVSLHLFDTPVGYTPAVGPPVLFRLDYNQRESTQPQTFLYSNLGQRWTFDWISYVKDDPANANASVTVFRRGGGEDVFTGFNAGTGAFAQNTRERLQLVRTGASPITYELRRPDGSRDVFTQSDASTVYPRRVFMTESYDPQGNALTFTYDAQLRLQGVTDAVGQVTTLTYGLPQDIWKITAITDPFGRTATMTYDAAGRLARVTDVIQLWSQFTYATDGFITSLSTPYGTSRFTKTDTGPDRRVDMTDPMGGQERIEFHVWETAPGLNSDPAGTVPTVAGVTFLNDYLKFRNTLYWDRKAMADAPGDRSKAHLYHWLHAKGNSSQAVSILESEKPALENRIWYLYANQETAYYEGDGRQPTITARVLDDGSTQVHKAEFNQWGQATKRIDPLGRETVFEYAANGVDLLTVKQKNGAGYDLLETRTWNSDHEPLTVIDAAGQTTTYTYTTAGLVQTVTNAKTETTTYAYNTSNQLTGVTGPVTGATSTFTYDGYGRLRTTTDADSYTVTTDYDAFDRPVQATYPDGTTEQTQYRFLDVARRKDRMGRWTSFTYDALRRQTSVRDPLGRVLQQEWCTCGSLNALIDPNGNRTSWDRDVQGRVTKETRANGSFTTYVYETTTSRLKKVTDPKLQDTNYTYSADDKLQQTTYTNAVIATPSVSFTYDTVYGRVATMLDGTGTTAYAYHAVTAPPALGATQLASVDGPLTNDTIAYAYDELGRVTTRAINGSANIVTWGFDSLGRTSSEANVLGTFAYTYDGPTGRVATVTYPNSQTSTYSYFGNSADRRLQTIHHKYPNGTTLSKFDYTYDVGGNIVTWRQQADSTAVLWSYGYDTADQLTRAVKASTDPTPAVLKRYAYVYDPAGNRTVEQIDDAVMGATHDNVNRIVSQQSSGALRLEGTVNELATVTVGGKPLEVSGANRFTGSIPIASGTTPFTVTAKDASGNMASQAFEVDSTAAGKAFTFDANGSMTSDGTRSLEWDVRKRLTAMVSGNHRTEFEYDGLDRRVRTSDRVDGVLVGSVLTVWCGTEICEERDESAAISRVFSLGEQNAGQQQLFVRDHLASVRAVTDDTGAIVSRADYDPYGRQTMVSGSAPPQGFAGHRPLSSEEFLLSLYRVYAPDYGRWLSRDPLFVSPEAQASSAFEGHYLYVKNRPVRYIDKLGLVTWNCDYQLSGAAEGKAAALLFATCTSECVGGKQVIASVSGSAVGAGAGPLPISFVWSSIKLTDRSSIPDAGNLQGKFIYFSAGGALWKGFSFTNMTLGSATNFGSGWQGFGSQTGLDLGAEFIGGSCAVTRARTTQCKGCCK